MCTNVSFCPSNVGTFFEKPRTAYFPRSRRDSLTTHQPHQQKVREIAEAATPWIRGDRSEIRERGNYFLATKVYLPSSSDSLSIQMTVHLPSPLNLAFTAPFLVSYTAHTSSLFSETLHS